MDFSKIADNLRESFRILALGRETGEVRELRGVSIASSGVTFQMFNAAFLSAPVATETELAQRILVTSLHFEARGQEWAFWVCEDWMDASIRKRARKIFEQHGLRHSVDLPGMMVERLLPASRPLPQLDVRPVTSAGTRDAFCAIGSMCFNVPLSWFREVFDPPAVWEHFQGYVGYLGQDPVCTAAIVVSDGVAGVYNVATVPMHQRRGFGEAVMRFALEDVRRGQGVQPSILQSTQAGFKLYGRMGYRALTNVAVYSA